MGTYQLVSWCFEPSQGNLSGNELTRNSSGNIRSQSSQLAESLWTDPGLKSGIIVRELISTFKKKKKKALAGNELSNILPKSSYSRKKPRPLMRTFIMLLSLLVLQAQQNLFLRGICLHILTSV